MEETPKADEEIPQLDPSEWKTDEAPMTPAQHAELAELYQQRGEPFDEPTLTFSQAAERLQALRGSSPGVSEHPSS